MSLFANDITLGRSLAVTVSPVLDASLHISLLLVVTNVPQRLKKPYNS